MLPSNPWIPNVQSPRNSRLQIMFASLVLFMPSTDALVPRQWYVLSWSPIQGRLFWLIPPFPWHLTLWWNSCGSHVRLDLFETVAFPCQHFGLLWPPNEFLPRSAPFSSCAAKFAERTFYQISGFCLFIFLNNRHYSNVHLLFLHWCGYRRLNLLHKLCFPVKNIHQACGVAMHEKMAMCLGACGMPSGNVHLLQ